MRRVVHWLLAGMGSLLWAFSAAAEPKSASPAVVTAPSTDEERAFEADAARYERLREFTQRLVREREQRTFEEASEHFSRLTELTRTLTEKAALVREREFDAEVELYLKKRALTRELSVQNAATSRAKSAMAESAPPSTVAAPTW